tara:strand:- start:20 stop:190 length:171 start_codon:yes stop_codon:yes gene_type:complete
MYKKFTNLGRRNFNKMIGLNFLTFLSLNFILRGKNFFRPYYKKKSKLKWILSNKDL